MPPLIESLGLTDPWTYFAVFLVASLLMLWRLEAMLDHGLEGTALGTLVMPYCSGLGNLLFVFIVMQHGGPAKEVLTNCLVNNVTNLTLLLGLPAVLFGLQVTGGAKAGKSAAKKSGGARGKDAGSGRAGVAAATGAQINRLSLLLTLAAVLFFTGGTWLLADDGKLTRTDGLMLIGLFLFWQTFQMFDVMKHNVQRKLSFGFLFYVDLVLVLAMAWALYESIDWLVAWITAQKTGFVSAANLGWLSGWLMVLPNALLALYWGWKRRADVVYSSQVGDGHICIPLCLGLLALFSPVAAPPLFITGLVLLGGAAIVHAFCLLAFGGLPRGIGAVLLGAYGWFLWTGLFA
ncbi:MAG: sodium:calcium symporter [Opitutae bacterium]|nr:sodium:calcium symporter [Opitutae bacterium]